ncbi:DUF4372 domain-containing protein [Clostridium gasigenes]|uniref:DUF4372 domain-containing protein n=1 Tax=Clostridium gasigenes TaxID=94869 RepID=UPI001C0AB3A1|nr:DUF4372 domain-containing protein [Clostridium gasigenes]MBU3109541.1 DUF4372 domain-containing protein [Clostridium gasigenes]
MKSTELKDVIISIAKQEFANKGFKASSMRAIARRSTFRKLIKLIDGNIGRNLRKENNQYKYSKNYTGRDHIMTMLFLQISGCDGLGDINGKYRNSSKVNKDFSMPTYSQLSRLNKSKSCDLFKNIFEDLLQKAERELKASVNIKVALTAT